MILEWATEAAPPLALSSSFGVDSAVMLHMVSRLETQPDVLYIDTGYHFDETQQHGEQLCDRLGLSYRHIRSTLAVAEHESVSGQQYRSDPNACCA